ncbi:uncharacterized protein V6R79_012184 [Siganus canaliculatus]
MRPQLMPIQWMKYLQKPKEIRALGSAVMFVVHLVFLVLLTTSTARSDIVRYIQGPWLIAEDDPQYEDTDGLAVERIWNKRPMVVEDVVVMEEQNQQTTKELYIVKEQDSGEGGQSAVWKILLVAAVLLVALLGSLSVAYYLCIWRGGRIHYEPQKECLV